MGIRSESGDLTRIASKGADIRQWVRCEWEFSAGCTGCLTSAGTGISHRHWSFYIVL